MASEGVPIQSLQFSPVRGGMNDSLFATEVAYNQYSLGRNGDLTWEGIFDYRGGSVKVSDTATGATDVVNAVHGYYTHSGGVTTRTTIIKAGTALYKFNATTLVFDAISGGGSLATGKPSIVNFLDGNGAEVFVYADGTKFFYCDGTTVTSLLTAWTNAGFTSAPKYLEVKDEVLWAAGDPADTSMVAFSNDNNPNVFNSQNVFRFPTSIGDEITGLKVFFDVLAVAKGNSIHIIAGKSINDYRQFRGVSGIGVSSHWSMQAVEDKLFFAHTSGIYMGRVDALREDGMSVERISGNIQRRYETAKANSHSSIGSYYDPRFGQIYWAIQTASSDYPDEILIFSVWHSSLDSPKNPEGADLRFVWSGVWTGLRANSLGLIEDSNGVMQAFAGGNDGFVRQFNSGSKDNRAVGATTGTNILFELQTKTKLFPGKALRIRHFFPVLFQYYNESLAVEWIVNDSQRLPIDENGASDPREIKFTGNIPYWNDGSDPDITEEWGSTIWSTKPLLQAFITVDALVYSISFIIIGNGTNATDDYAYAGELEDVQVKYPRGRG